MTCRKVTEVLIHTLTCFYICQDIAVCLKNLKLLAKTTKQEKKLLNVFSKDTTEWHK